MYIKYCTNDLFDNKAFAGMLNTMGVLAVPVKGGLLLDIDAFNALSPAIMPHWMYVNRKLINSPYHTFPVARDDFYEALGA